MEFEEFSLFNFKYLIIFPLYFLLIIIILIILYFSMTALIVSIIPTILLLLTKLFYPKKELIFFCFYLPFLIIGIPFISLFLGIIFDIFLSFFKDFWTNINFKKILNFIILKINSGNYSKKSITLKIFLYFFIFYLLFIYMLKEKNDSTIKNSGILMILIGLIPPLKGIYKIIFFSWKYFLKNHINNDNNFQNIDEIDEGLIPKELFDPLNLSEQKKWINFIEDPECNIFQNKKSNKSRIIGFLIFGLNIFLIIICLIIVFKIGNILTLIFPILLIITLPFSIIFNFSLIFLPDEKFENKGNIKLLIKFTLILYGIVFIFLIIFSILIQKWNEPQLSNLIYSNQSHTNHSVIFNKPSFCFKKFLNQFNFIEFSSFILLPRLFEPRINTNYFKSNSSKVIYDNLMLYIFENKYNFTINSLANDYSILNISFNNNSIISLGGFETSYDWYFFLELYILLLLPNLIKSIIPFFNIIFSFSPYPFLLFINLFSSLFFIPPVSNLYLNNLNKNSNNYFQYYKNYPLFIGQNIGGYLVKEISKNLPIQGISFEGINNLITKSEFEFYKNDNFLKYSIGNIYNFYSKDSFFNNIEENIHNNILLPSIKSNYNPLNVFESFSLITAQCSNDDRYVPLCNQLLSYNDNNGTNIYKLFINLFK